MDSEIWSLNGMGKYGRKKDGRLESADHLVMEEYLGK